MHPQTVIDTFCALLFIDAWKSQLEKHLSWYLSLYYLCLKPWLWLLLQNARCGAEQTQTVTREAPTITHIPGNSYFLVSIISQTIFNALKEFL